MSANDTAMGTRPDRIRSDTLADSVVILLSLTAAQRLVGFLRGVLFCRWLDTEALGQWDISYGFLTLAAPVAVLGLPGSFGRYAEHFRGRGQLRTFVRRILIASTVLSVVAIATLFLFPEPFARLVYGAADQSNLLLAVAGALGALVTHNVLASLFSALRQSRRVSALQFVQSIMFATIGLTLVACWQASAISIVVAFAAACACASILGAFWLWQTWRELPEIGQSAPYRAFWSKLAPFAAWLWLTNWVDNLFELTDRYLLVHFGGLTESEAFAQIGQYHTARIIPLLLVGVTELLAATITPYLSQDWEAGRRGVVTKRLNLSLKLLGWGLTLVSASVLLVAPTLFNVAFGGKYAAGQALLPWTLTCGAWCALACVAANYLWCAEKARLVTVVLLVSLLLNLTLGAWLVPILGLQGAVFATSAGRLTALALVLVAAFRYAWRPDLGVVLALLSSFTLFMGPHVALALVAIVAWQAVAGTRLLSAEDKSSLAAVWSQYTSRLRRRFPSRPALTDPSL